MTDNHALFRVHLRIRRSAHSVLSTDANDVDGTPPEFRILDVLDRRQTKNVLHVLTLSARV